MLIRMFVKSSNLDESKKVCDDILNGLEKYICEKRYLSNKLYWKMDSVLTVEINLKLKEKISVGELEKFLSLISDKWKTYGNPINEVLISNTMHECNMKRSEIVMLNMFFENSEV